MLFLGYSVYRKNRNAPENRVFAIISICTSIWLATTILTAAAKTSENALFWVRLTLVGPILFAPSFYQFSKFFPPKGNKFLGLKTLEILLLAIPCAVMLIFVPTDLNVLRATINSKNLLDLRLGALYPVFFIYFLAYVGLAAKNFLTSYRSQTQSNKLALNLMLIGLILTVTAATILNVILPLLGTTSLAGLGSFSSIFFVGFTAYAILSYQRFDIRIALTEFASITVVSTMVVEVVVISSDWRTRLTGLIVTLIAAYGSSILIKSVKRVIEQKNELENLANDLVKANKKLEELDKMKTEFVSVASHELLSPISAIEGYLSMILEEKMVKIEDPKAVKYMDSVFKSSKRLGRLVTDLLNVTRIEEGRLSVQKIEIDAKNIINQVVDELRFNAEGAKLTISTYFQEGADTMIYVDPDRIKEVLINITGNSIKYTPEGGHIELGCFVYETSNVNKKYDEMQEDVIKCSAGPVDESLQRAIDDRQKQFVGDKQLVIFAKDTGIGLKPDDLCRLFKKFSRVGEWSTRKVQGTGLGLYVSRALVEMHHGRIWAESAGINAGSQFFFSVPLAKNKGEIDNIDKVVLQAKGPQTTDQSEMIG